jgi:hypothetical protein
VRVTEDWEDEKQGGKNNMDIRSSGQSTWEENRQRTVVVSKDNR